MKNPLYFGRCSLWREPVICGQEELAFRWRFISPWIEIRWGLLPVLGVTATAGREGVDLSLHAGIFAPIHLGP